VGVAADGDEADCDEDILVSAPANLISYMCHSAICFQGILPLGAGSIVVNDPT